MKAAKGVFQALIGLCPDSLHDVMSKEEARKFWDRVKRDSSYNVDIVRRCEVNIFSVLEDMRKTSSQEEGEVDDIRLEAYIRACQEWQEEEHRQIVLTLRLAAITW